MYFSDAQIGFIIYFIISFTVIIALAITKSQNSDGNIGPLHRIENKPLELLPLDERKLKTRLKIIPLLNDSLQTQPSIISPRSTISPLKKFQDRYLFPTSLVNNTNKKPIICIISFGGSFRNSDLDAYWTACGNVGTRPVVTKHNTQFEGSLSNDASIENTLDLQIAMNLCPFAEFHIFYGHNSLQGFYNLFSNINTFLISNRSSSAYGAKVVSISWGLPELFLDPKFAYEVNELFRVGVSNSITYCAASGDYGSTDGIENSTNGYVDTLVVDFPSACPYVVACGGTVLNGSTEQPWTGGGGGFSYYFSQPAYQTAKINAQASVSSRIPTFVRSTSLIKNRSVPDIAMNASPTNAFGWPIIYNGASIKVGGTSCVSPAMSAFIALVNKTGYNTTTNVLTKLYTANSSSFWDITTGPSNDSFGYDNANRYFPQVGFDQVTGLGAIKGTTLRSFM